MESIFESLENLNVSESCYNEIMEIVENLLDMIDKSNRSSEDKRNLKSKVKNAHDKEEVQAMYREKLHPAKHTLKRYFSKRRLQDDALEQGDKKELVKKFWVIHTEIDRYI